MRYILFSVAIFFLACQSKTAQKSSTFTQTTSTVQGTHPSITVIEKSEAEWKAELTAMEFKVLRKAGTERPFTGDLLKKKEAGTYTCRGCGLELFASETKFKSGTGWPSFYEPVNEINVEEDTDYHLGYARTEVHCVRCKGHLGHVFKDGPEPTGLRYCINSVSLDFEAKAP